MQPCTCAGPIQVQSDSLVSDGEKVPEIIGCRPAKRADLPKIEALVTGRTREMFGDVEAPKVLLVSYIVKSFIAKEKEKNRNDLGVKVERFSAW